MSLERKLPDELTLEFVDGLIQNFLEDADLLFHVLDKDAHKTSFTLLGEVVNVTVARKPYKAAAGDILEKGKVKLAELQSVKSNVQDDKVVEEKSNEGEGEPTKELSSETQTKISVSSIKAGKTKEQKIASWWNQNKHNWLWSGCVVDRGWDDFTKDEKDDIAELYRMFAVYYSKEITSEQAIKEFGKGD